ncbi:MAG: hypothetical protein ACYTGJ_09625 [Planctomycetota bacterium]
MIDDDFGGEPTLPEGCRRALEAWVCEEPDRETPSHIEECPTCRGLAESIAFDRALLRWQLSRVAPPPAPVLPLREPLRSASGHPRRVSLTLLPFLLGVILVLLLAIQLLLGTIGGRARGADPLLRQVERAAVGELGTPDGAEGSPPSGWASLLLPRLGPGWSLGERGQLRRGARVVELRPSSEGEEWEARWSASPARTGE